MVRLHICWIPAGLNVWEQGWIHSEGGKASLLFGNRVQILSGHIFFFPFIFNTAPKIVMQMSSPVFQSKGWTWQGLADWAKDTFKIELSKAQSLG